MYACIHVYMHSGVHSVFVCACVHVGVKGKNQIWLNSHNMQNLIAHIPLCMSIIHICIHVCIYNIYIVCGRCVHKGSVAPATTQPNDN